MEQKSPQWEIFYKKPYRKQKYTKDDEKVIIKLFEAEWPAIEIKRLLTGL